VKKYIFILITLYSGLVLSQEIQVGITRTRTTINNNFSADMVYNKITGQRMSKSAVHKLIKNNPNLQLENVYNKSGEIIKYLYNPENNTNFSKSSAKGSIESGNQIPEFIFKTVQGEKLDSEKLKGKWLIIRFEGFAESFTIKHDELKELHEKIDNSEFKKSIAAIIIFQNDENSIEKLFPNENSNFKVVTNGIPFHRIFKITRTPKTLVIDPNGVLVNSYNYSEDIDLEGIITDN